MLMVLNEKEHNKLSEILTCIEKQFDAELDAIAEVFNVDENGIDIEVKFDDDTSEQMFIEMKLLKSDSDAEEIAGQIG